MDRNLEIYLVCVPGLEDMLAAEVRELGFDAPMVSPGGVTVTGGWEAVAHLNMWSRGATRVLVRIAAFRAMHLAQLDKRARKIDWTALLAPGTTVRVEATCRKSRIYHAGAAKQRLERALTDVAGAKLSDDAALSIKLRIDDDMCTVSVDTSGEPLHKRGHKSFVGKAPLRETMAALMLRRCGYDGVEPVVDPMCGSGTFPIEAAEIAQGLAPGRDRIFAYQSFANAPDPGGATGRGPFVAPTAEQTPETVRAFGRDRDAGAIRGATENAKRAGVLCDFQQGPLSDLAPPSQTPGLVMVNPPYGARIGNRKLLFGLYGSLGQALTERFQGWRVGLVTSDAGLAKATNLPFLDPDPPIAHGGLKVTLWRTGDL